MVQSAHALLHSESPNGKMGNKNVGKKRGLQERSAMKENKNQ